MKRRIFLQGLGGVTIAAPLLTSLGGSRAIAQTDVTKRMVIFLTHNGCVTDKWFPNVENGTIDAAALAGTTLEPLTPFANKLLFPRGMRSLNEYTQTQSIDPHDQAMGAKLTCSTIDANNKRYATSISIDHVVANAINPGTGKTPLVLSVGASSTSVKEICSYSAPITPFPANVNPQTVFAELTKVFTEPGSTPSTPVTMADYHVAMGGSVVDSARDDLMRLKALAMSASDRNKLDVWLTLLDETTSGIVQMGGGGAQCTDGGLGITSEAVSAAGTGGGTGNSLAQSFTLGGDMMLKLIALTMVCDTNRSIVMTYPGYVKFNWDGMAHTSEHHGLSHRNGSSIEVGGTCQAHVMEDLADIDNWFAGKFTNLISSLAEIPEGDVSVLDNSAVAWIQELSDGNAHNQNNLPILIAGGLGGYLKQGHTVNVETGKDSAGRGSSSKNCTNGNTDNSNFFTGSSGSQVPINKLYVTLMNGLGMRENGEKITKFGVYDKEKTDGITDPGELEDLLA